MIATWDALNPPPNDGGDLPWLKRLVDRTLAGGDPLREAPSEGEARPAAQTVCAHCGLAEGHSRRCSVTKLGVDESRMTATPVPQGPSEAMPVALVDNLPEVPPDAVRCPESTAIGRCVLVSDHTDLHRIVVTWGRRRATPSSGDGGQDKP
jgi:hypothetical protein